ncbi:MAG: Fic family protein [Geminicoccaceae bacterium]
MWDEIAKKKAELDAKRPLTPKSVAALDAWYDVELTYSSNAIEGNTLTHNETALVIEKGITIGGKTLNEHLEAVDHHAAIKYVRELAKAEKPISEDDILKIHEMVLNRSNPAEAGRYSQFQRRITGSNVILPGPHKVPYLMDEFGQWLNGQPDTPKTAFESHYRLVSIHPFTDGNGRTARLLMNLVLLRGGYPPVSIGPPERKAYIDALEHRHLTEDAEPYEELMAMRLNVSLSDYLDAIEKELEARRSGPSTPQP